LFVCVIKAGNDDLSRSPPGEYSDEIPVRGLNSLSQLDKPPYLPPQLLNIVLNKDTSAKCEPALLPEPNHVMLKHLYALSIRVTSFSIFIFYETRNGFLTPLTHTHTQIGRRDGAQLDVSLQAKVCHNLLLQAHLVSLRGRKWTKSFLLFQNK
jgi:hypothetical protein